MGLKEFSKAAILAGGVMASGASADDAKQNDTIQPDQGIDSVHVFLDGQDITRLVGRETHDTTTLAECQEDFANIQNQIETGPRQGSFRRILSRMNRDMGTTKESTLSVECIKDEETVHTFEEKVTIGGPKEQTISSAPETPDNDDNTPDSFTVS